MSKSPPCATRIRVRQKRPARFRSPPTIATCSNDDISAVVNATPNYLHHEITLEALARGKHVLCEKPLSLDTARATEMLRAAEKAGVIHMAAYTYRYTPALQYMLHLVSSDELGTIRTVRAAYQMALSGHLLGWRSTKAQAGSGVLADIGSHLIIWSSSLPGRLPLSRLQIAAFARIPIPMSRTGLRFSPSSPAAQAASSRFRESVPGVARASPRTSSLSCTVPWVAPCFRFRIPGDSRFR
jgi:hypothetical protein